MKTAGLHIKDKKLKGISLIELLLSIALFSILVTGLSSAVFYLLQSQKDTAYRAKAIFLAQEGIEAVKIIKKNNFSSLASGNYALSTSANTWSLVAGIENIDGYQRQITISTIDANTFRAISTVTWNDTFNSQQVQYSTYFTNWERYTPINTWNSTTQVAGINFNGSNDGYKLEFVNNLVYFIRLGGTPNFSTIDTTNLAAPVTTSNINLSGNGGDIQIQGNNVFISSSNNSGEFYVYNISTPTTPSLVTTYNASGNSDGLRLAVQGNYLYLLRTATADREFQIYNISALPTVTALGSLDFTATPNDIEINGNYAYIATGVSTQEMIIVNISNPNSPSVASTVNVSDSRICNSVKIISPTYAALGCNDGLIHFINISNPLAPSISSTFTVGASGVTTMDIEYYSGFNLLFLATSNSAREFQTVNISNILLPTLYGSRDMNGTNNDVEYDSVRNVVYIASTDNNFEFITLTTP